MTSGSLYVTLALQYRNFIEVNFEQAYAIKLNKERKKENKHIQKARNDMVILRQVWPTPLVVWNYRSIEKNDWNYEIW